VTVTLAHRAIISNAHYMVTYGLVGTLCYGAFFTLIQYYEYSVAPFGINDSVYGSLFFILTGFHGFHIIVGSIMLLVCLIRHFFHHFSPQHHVGLECSIWY